MESKATMRRTAEHRRLQLAATSDLGPALGPLLARSAYVASYHPVGCEPFVTIRQGWLLPVVLDDGDLDWAVDTGEYVRNRFGIPEPAGPRLGVSAVAECDLVLVPALLVDREGYRLGRGGGSYDRALARATGFTVALLHDGELVDHVPREAHDVAVDAVATPSLGVLRLPMTGQQE